MIMLYRNIKQEREGGDYFVSSDISTQPEGGDGGDLILRFRTSWVGGGGSRLDARVCLVHSSSCKNSKLLIAIRSWKWEGLWFYSLCSF